MSVFFAQDMTTASVTLVADAQWSVVDTPEFAINKSWGSNALCSADTPGGELSRKQTGWADERAKLNRALTSALGPLVPILEPLEQSIVLYLSGWCHTIPLAPALATTLPRTPLIAVSMAHTVPSAETPKPDYDFVGIACPGAGKKELKKVVGDSEFAASQFANGQSFTDPALSVATEVLQRARWLLLGGLAVASKFRPQGAHFELKYENLRVSDLLKMDLQDCECILMAACETVGIDGYIPESGLSLALAPLFAGARSSLGSHWRVSDSDASAFSREFFRQAANGTALGAAYVGATKNAGNAQFTLFVQNAEVLRV